MNRPNRWDALKCVALLSMFIDHAGHFYFDDIMILRAIGRAAAFIFLFLTGFAPHYRQDRTLWGLATLLTLNDWIVIGHVNTLNILWTILLLRMMFGWLERTGRIALKLHEWVICSIITVFTLKITQYGSMGLLIGLSGFVYKHGKDYNTRTQAIFLALNTILYGALMGFLFQMDASGIIQMAFVLIFTVFLLRWFLQAPLMPLAYTVGTAKIITFISRYSGYIYVIHLIALGWLTGKPI